MSELTALSEAARLREPKGPPVTAYLPPAIAEQDKWPRTQEALVCAQLAQAEGDRQFSLGNEYCAYACWKIAAQIRERLNGVLAPF